MRQTITSMIAAVIILAAWTGTAFAISPPFTYECGCSADVQGAVSAGCQLTEQLCLFTRGYSRTTDVLTPLVLGLDRSKQVKVVYPTFTCPVGYYALGDTYCIGGNGQPDGNTPNLSAKGSLILSKGPVLTANTEYDKEIDRLNGVIALLNQNVLMTAVTIDPTPFVNAVAPNCGPVFDKACEGVFSDMCSLRGAVDRLLAQLNATGGQVAQIIKAGPCAIKYNGVAQDAAINAILQNLTALKVAINEVSLDQGYNVFTLAGAGIPTVAPLKKKEFTGSLACKSTIFDCDKPLAFLTLPIGSYCSMSVVDLNKREKIMLIEGDQATLFLNPMTRRAVTCTNGNAGKCAEDPIFYAMGENADGSTQTLVVPSGGLVIPGKPGAIIAKVLESAKPLTDVVSTPVAESCDTLLKGIKDEAEKVGFQPDVGTIDLNSIKTPVKVGKVALEGRRAIMSYTTDSKKAGPQPAADVGGELVPGIGIVTLGDSKETTTQTFKPFPNTITGYTEAIDLAVGKSTDKVVNVVISLSKGTEKKALGTFACSVPLDESPMACEKLGFGAMGDKASIKPILTAKLKETARKGTGSEDLGAGFADILLGTPIEAYPELVMHKFEGFSDVPNSVYYDPAGGHVYRLNPDKTVTVIADELLPGADKCLVTDLDIYGGKDLTCLAGNIIYFVPKRNLPPVIDVITLNPEADKPLLGTSVRTQEDEDLGYQWKVYEVKDGALVDHTDLLSDASAPIPELHLGVDAASASASAKTTHVDMKDLSGIIPDITINAAITKTIKSMGTKDSSGVPQDGYFAVLTVKDAGGLSDTALIPIPTSKGLSATLGSGFAHMFAIEGCSLSRGIMITGPATLVLMVLLVLPLGVLVPMRVQRRKK